MKRTIFSGLAISALLIAAPMGIAGAADLPVKSYAPVPAPVATWTACYVGGNAGEAWVEKSNVVFEIGATGPLNAPLGTASATGWAYGGQIGCDYQVNSNWVIGARAMFDAANVKGSTAGSGNGLPVEVIFNFTTSSFATAVARVGYLLTPTLMFYGVGGVATVRDKYSIVAPTEGGTFGIASETRTGFDAGAGISWMFNPNWDLWFEYDYMGFGRKDVNFTGVGTAASFTLGVSQTVQKILVGVDYRFGMAR